MSGVARKKRRQSDSGPPMSPLPPMEKPLDRGDRVALGILIALYLILALLHALVTPTGQTGYQDAPDEAAHVNYVRVLARGHLPVPSDPALPKAEWAKAYEWHQPPLYYAIDVPFLALGERGARFLSILCGVICLLLIFRTVRVFAPDDSVLALTAVGIAALTPEHIAITSTVNNDALLEVCFSSVILVLIRSLKGGFTLGRACWLGLWLATALLTKLTGLLLLPVAALGLLLCIRTGEKPSSVLKNAGVSAAIVVLLCSVWFIRNVRLYHEPVPMHAFQQAFAGTVQAQDVATRHGAHQADWGGYAELVSIWSFQSFWAVYGTPASALRGVPVFLPDSVYYLLALVCLAALAGLVRLHFKRISAFTEYQRSVVWIQWTTVGLVTLSFAGFVSHYFQTQGRYLYPAMSGIAMLLALGWLAVFPERYRRLAGGFLLMLLGLFCVVFLLTITNHS